MPVNDCVGSECTVTQFVLTDIAAKKWAGTDRTGTKIEGDIKADASYKSMRDFFEKSLRGFYSPNPKTSGCKEDCRCKKDDTDRILRGPNTDSHEWEVEYTDPSGSKWILSGTYTLQITVLAGTCRPPKKTRPPGGELYFVISDEVIPAEVLALAGSEEPIVG